MIRRTLFAVAIFWHIHSFAQTLYYPDTSWHTKSPRDVKMNAALVDSAVKFAVANESSTDEDLRLAILKAYADEPDFHIAGPTKERGKAAGLIIKNGYIIAQWGDISRADMTFSVTKSFLSTVAGLAFDNHIIKNVDETVGTYVDDKYSGPHNASITWRHLLNQSSDWSGCLFNVCDWADRPPKEGTIDQWRNRELVPPGTKFEYNDVRVNLLAYSLLQVWRKPLPVVLKEKIMDPVGASTTWRWYGYDNSFVNVDGVMVQSVSGGGHFGGGMFISSLDQARFGLLFARNGKWKNEQLISKQWIAAATTPSHANKSYGYLWWLNAEGRAQEASRKVYWAEGFGGNIIVIDEQNDLVMVARWLEPAKIPDFINIVERALK